MKQVGLRRPSSALGLILVLGLSACGSAEGSSPLVAPASLPTQILTPAPPPTPTVPPLPKLTQLTDGGCCIDPYWSPDGAEVWYLDRPNESAQSGVWGVSVLGGESRFVTDRLGIYSRDGSLRAYPESGQTYVERVSTGKRWRVPNEGRAVEFSPDGSRIAWLVASSSTANFDSRAVSVWVAQADGTEARAVADLIGGGFLGWFPDGQRMLVINRMGAAGAQFFAALNPEDGGLAQIVQAADPATRLRGGLLSPDGGWLAYQIVFSGQPLMDGMWVVRTDGSNALKLDVFGAYRWRSDGRLLVVPLESGAASHRLVEVDASTGELRNLTDPAATQFRIAGGDWAVSPDGDHVTFVSAVDHNIWVIELPE